MSRTTNERREYLESLGSVHRGCKCQRMLQGIETELEELREQNRLLHDSASFFADLSERLNGQLRQQKAQGGSAQEAAAARAMSTPQGGATAADSGRGR